MIHFLVDANVLSEPAKHEPDASVVSWLRRHENRLFVNPIIVGELRYGILLLAEGRRRMQLETWFRAGVDRLPNLDIDAATADVWASLLAELKRQGRAMSVKDSLIAATARQHHLTVATRNVDHFLSAGVELLNPFE